MKNKAVDKISRIEKSLHSIYLVGVEMEVMNASGTKNHKDKEIICTLGAIQKQIDVVIKDLES